MRRTRIAIETGDGGLGAASTVADLMAPLLGWDGAARAAELDDYRREVDLVHQAAMTASDDQEAARLADGTPSLLPFP